MGDKGIDFLEAAVIEQAPDPLPGGPFPFAVLSLNGLGTSALLECSTAAEQLLIELVWGHGLLP